MLCSSWTCCFSCCCPDMNVNDGELPEHERYANGLIKTTPVNVALRHCLSSLCSGLHLLLRFLLSPRPALPRLKASSCQLSRRTFHPANTAFPSPPPPLPPPASRSSRIVFLQFTISCLGEEERTGGHTFVGCTLPSTACVSWCHCGAWIGSWFDRSPSSSSRGGQLRRPRRARSRVARSPGPIKSKQSW